MGNESGEWIIYGLDENDDARLRDVDGLIEHVNKVGFLPLFRNELHGFSVEEHTVSKHWWSGDEAHDPWEWRTLAARSGQVAYGKFFSKKAGFISLEWLPRFINYRRDGYDFDARCDEGMAKHRERRLMQAFIDRGELFSFEARQLGGFTRGGEKNFEGTLADLQMQTYLVIKDFRQRRNRHGEPYGWDIAVFATPESLWGEQLVTSAYGEEPEESRRAVYEHLGSLFPGDDECSLKRLLG